MHQWVRTRRQWQAGARRQTFSLISPRSEATSKSSWRSVCPAPSAPAGPAIACVGEAALPARGVESGTLSNQLDRGVEQRARRVGNFFRHREMVESRHRDIAHDVVAPPLAEQRALAFELAR